MTAKMKLIDYRSIVDQHLWGVEDVSVRDKVITKAKREKKWLSNADFFALVNFKKLGTNESTKQSLTD